MIRAECMPTIPHMSEHAIRKNDVGTSDAQRAGFEASAPSPALDPIDADQLLGSFNANPPGLSLFALIAEDYRTHDCNPFSEGFWALATHRFGNWRMSIRPRLLRAPCSLLYAALRKACLWFGGIKLDYTVRVGRRVRIWHAGGMTLGALEIGDDTQIRPNTTFGVKRRGDERWLKPRIGRRCDIGVGAVLLGGITIGDDCVIGANVVLARTIPARSIVTVEPPTVRTRRMNTPRAARKSAIASCDGLKRS